MATISAVQQSYIVSFKRQTQTYQITLHSFCTALSEHLYAEFLFLYMKLTNAGRINPDFEAGRGTGDELTAETPFFFTSLAVLIGSTAHDSTFGEAFLSQHRWRGEKDNPNSSLTSCAEHILLKPAGAAPL